MPNFIAGPVGGLIALPEDRPEAAKEGATMGASPVIVPPAQPENRLDAANEGATMGASPVILSSASFDTILVGLLSLRTLRKKL